MKLYCHKIKRNSNGLDMDGGEKSMPLELESMLDVLKI